MNPYLLLINSKENKTNGRRGVSLRIVFKVEDFLKIEKAEIDITNFSVFIGNNNSGKTKLMELIYGVQNYLSKTIPSMNYHFRNNRVQFPKEKIGKFIDTVNSILENEKEEILQSIFNKEMSVGSMKFEITEIDEWYEAIVITNDNIDKLYERNRELRYLNYIYQNNIEKLLEEKTLIAVYAHNESNNVKGRLLNVIGTSNKSDRSFAKMRINKTIMCRLFGIEDSSLFFPASRMGLAMLYKEYFNSLGSNRRMWIDEESSLVVDTYQQSNHVTKPVLDFLRFLQGYSYNVSGAKKNADLIEFVNEHLLEGALDENGEIAAYTPKGSDIKVPLYLSSSMINELDPIMKMLTARDQTTMLYYDEIETSLHPLKQLEMVKLLNRLNNKGMRIIVATHSDTFVTKLNNLLLLARSGKVGEEPVYLRDGKIEISKDDLLKTDDIHIYQFINKSNGRSEVKELEFRTAPMTGYSFELFEDSSTSLFEETKLALGIE